MIGTGTSVGSRAYAAVSRRPVSEIRLWSYVSVKHVRRNSDNHDDAGVDRLEGRSHKASTLASNTRRVYDSQDEKSVVLSMVDCAKHTTSGAKAMVARYVAIQFVVFLLFSPYLANVTTGYVTRRNLMWTLHDSIAVLACMVVLALAGLGLSQLIRRRNRPPMIRFCEHFFLFVFGAGVLAVLGFYIPAWKAHVWITPFAWLVLVGLIAFSWRRPTSRAVSSVRVLCLVMSPTMLIVAGQLLQATTYPPTVDPISLSTVASTITRTAASDKEKPSSSVYLIILDAWSYRRTFENGAVLPHLVNLAAFAKQSVTFHDAHSLGSNTRISIPRLLYQTDLPTHLGKIRVGFKKNGAYMSPRGLRCLFSAVPPERYRTYAIGFHVRYRQWLGDRVDVCREYSWFPQGHNFASACAIHAVRAMQYWLDPVSSQWYSKMKVAVDDRHAVQIYEAIRQDALDVIKQQSSAKFALVHVPVPHMPYLFDGSGNYNGPSDHAWEWDHLEGYRRNLACADHLVGEFMSALKEVDKFDDALVILTSDHTWGDDPAYERFPEGDAVTHVPFIVKLPRQRSPVTVNSRFDHGNLAGLIQYALAAPDAVAGLGDFLSTVAAPGDSASALEADTPWSAPQTGRDQTGSAGNAVNHNSDFTMVETGTQASGVAVSE
ncbi:MAG: sulfatase-like hydrolase/transferase [Planctomycetes bacterium]|nr:sulfatase-like hydrolase/transferase [Planctomycetota bacterium]